MGHDPFTISCLEDFKCDIYPVIWEWMNDWIRLYSCWNIVGHFEPSSTWQKYVKWHKSSLWHRWNWNTLIATIESWYKKLCLLSSSNIKLFLIYITLLMSSYLQWITTGFCSLCLSISFLTLCQKLSKPVACRGTPWSGQEV